MNTNPLTIMVGVADREDSEAAVRYAVDEARRRRAPVQLVHVIHPMLLDADGDADDARLSSEPIWRAAGELLDETADFVGKQLGPDLPVTTRLVIGHPANGLVDVGEHAAVVVLQPDRTGHHHYLPTFSITNTVATRSRQPVVAVPAHWDAPLPSGVVTVGVDAAGAAAHLVQTALEEAQARSARLCVLHTWLYSDAYDDVVFPGPAKDAHSASLADELRRELAPLTGKFEDVPVEIVVRRGRPADELLRESGGSDLVIVGRHRTGRRASRYLGSIARTAIRESRCPVMVVDPVDPLWVTEDFRA